MTVEAAILSFYLLFPILTDGQIFIDRKLSSEIMPERQRFQEIEKIKDFIAGKRYIDDSSLIIERHVPLLMNEIGLGAEEILHKNEEDKIRLLEFGVEKFTAEKDCGSVKNIVNVNNRQFMQSSYDKNYRLKEKTLWQNSEKSNDIKLLQRISYFYGDNKEIPYRAYYEYMTKNKIEDLLYYDSGSPKKRYTYLQKDGKNVLVKLESYFYDSKNRLKSEELTSYVLSVPSSKTIYSYTKKSRKPDTKYYENGVLRISTNYETYDTYRVTTYFDNKYSITVTYKNKKKLKEVVHLNGVRQRERTFND